MVLDVEFSRLAVTSKFSDERVQRRFCEKAGRDSETELFGIGLRANLSEHQVMWTKREENVGSGSAPATIEIVICSGSEV